MTPKIAAILLKLRNLGYRLRTDLRGMAGPVFAAAGLRPPAPVAALGNVPMS